MSKKNYQKLLQQMAGKKKKKVKKPDARTEALKGRKYFSKGSGEKIWLDKLKEIIMEVIFLVILVELK